MHWLRARAQRDRWAEEVALLEAEMECTKLYFIHRAEKWSRVFADARYAHRPRHLAYAARQARMWCGFLQQAADRFQSVKTAAENDSLLLL